jgi:hypothetical protein
MPQNSYGIQKLIGELLVGDYSRKGFIDGRAVRLPTVSIRPGKPNAAASSFASGIARTAQRCRSCLPSRTRDRAVADIASLAVKCLLHLRIADGKVRRHRFRSVARHYRKRRRDGRLSRTDRRSGRLIASLGAGRENQAIVGWRALKQRADDRPPRDEGGFGQVMLRSSEGVKYNFTKTLLFSSLWVRRGRLHWRKRSADALAPRPYHIAAYRFA